MWSFVTVYGLSAIALLVVYYRWTRRKAIAALAKMNGPPKLPLLGHAFLIKYTSQEKIFEFFIKLGNTYPSPLGIQLGPIDFVVIYRPDHLQAVFSSQHCISRPFWYDFFRVSRGIFSSPAHIWKGQRKVLNHAFGPGVLNSFVSIFNEKSTILTKMMSVHVGRGERDFGREMGKAALDTIYSTAVGLNFGSQEAPEGDKYLELQEEFSDLVLQRCFSVIYYIEKIYQLTKGYKREQEILSYCRTLTNRVMHATNVDEILSGAIELPSVKAEETDGRKPQNFLNKLLELAVENRQQFTKDDIRENLDTIVSAGTGTTAITMSNLLLMLAMHPDIQERVYQEVMEVCPDINQPVSMEDTAKLTYTEMVCKETMRLFPVGPLIGRVAEADITLDDEHMIPAGSQIGCAIYMVHRDRAIWGPEANEFDPDHFLPENIEKIHPYAYLPFSGGIRNCIGIRYAWVSMKIMIVHILRKYRLKTSLTMDQLTLHYCLLLKIGNGCWISVENRN